MTAYPHLVDAVLEKARGRGREQPRGADLVVAAAQRAVLARACASGPLLSWVWLQSIGSGSVLTSLSHVSHRARCVRR